jgi:hypothetical protein
MKNISLGIVVLTALLLGASAATPAATAPATIDISKVTCSDLIKADALDRAAVVMFYWGYAAAKAGVSTFKTGVLQSATEHLMGVCQKNPSQTMFAAMRDTDLKAF